MAHCYVGCGRHLISDIIMLMRVCPSASASAAHLPPTQHLCVFVHVLSDVSGNPVPFCPLWAAPRSGVETGVRRPTGSNQPARMGASRLTIGSEDAREGCVASHSFAYLQDA